MKIFAYKNTPYEVEDNPSIELESFRVDKGIEDERLIHCSNVIFWKKEREMHLPYKWISWAFISGSHSHMWLEVAPGYLKELRRFCRENKVDYSSYPHWHMPGLMPVEHISANELTNSLQALKEKKLKIQVHKMLNELVDQHHPFVKRSKSGKALLIKSAEGWWRPISSNALVLKEQVHHLYPQLEN